MTLSNCPVCGASALEQRIETRRMRFEGASLKYESKYLVCATCESETVTPEQARSNKRAVIAAKRAHLRIPSPDALRRWRKKWKLTQEAAGKLLGVGTTAFSKYENSALLPSAPTTRLIDAVLHSDTVVRALAKKYEVVIVERPDSRNFYGAANIPKTSVEWLLQHHLIVATAIPPSHKISAVKVVKKTIGATPHKVTVAPSGPVFAGCPVRSINSTQGKSIFGDSHVAYH